MKKHVYWQAKVSIHPQNWQMNESEQKNGWLLLLHMLN